MRARVLLCATSLLLLPADSGGGDRSTPLPNPMLDAMSRELERSLEEFAEAPDPPYFLSYEITELERVVVSSSFGVLNASRERRTRQLDVDLRVGDYSMDNTRQIRGQSGRFENRNRRTRVPVPLDDDEQSLRAALWLETDARYKQARERLTRVRTNVQVAVEQEDASADFSRETAVKHLEPKLSLEIERSRWEDLSRRFGRAFAQYGDIYRARTSLTGEVETRWYVNSEGSRLRVSQPSYRLTISASTKAPDGMELPRYESFYSSSPDGLPGDDEIQKTVARMIEDLQALRQAPIVDPFTGPAILSGRASGVFFHEVFGHRIEGHRLKDEGDGQTFRKLLGEAVLPESFSVVFDPTLTERDGVELSGHYRFDNEGVAARPVPVISDGKFERFLMSRTPIEGFGHSNGHGRREPGHEPVSRQSNLLVKNSLPLTSAQLKTRLLEEVERQGKPYGLRFEDVQGGFALTGRSTPNAFNVFPIVVYRVYPDGREELVRGVDLIGTPLTTFSRIVASDGGVEVFNGTCGAESGGVSVSASSPAVLISQIEVQKKAKSQDRPPILEAPLGERREGER